MHHGSGSVDAPRNIVVAGSDPWPSCHTSTSPSLVVDSHSKYSAHVTMSKIFGPTNTSLMIIRNCTLNGSSGISKMMVEKDRSLEYFKVGKSANEDGTK